MTTEGMHQGLIGQPASHLESASLQQRRSPFGRPGQEARRQVGLANARFSLSRFSGTVPCFDSMAKAKL
jgi:hypothetical protein